jgi:integrase
MTTSSSACVGSLSDTNPNIRNQTGSKRVSKNAQQLHNTEPKGTESGKVGKTDVRYWAKRVEKPAPRDGYQSPFYSVQIAYRGRRMRFPLETNIRQTAAEKAQRIYLSLLSSGWDQTLEKHKPKSVKAVKTATVGSLIEAVRSHAGIRPGTFNSYSIALRLIASQVEGIKEIPVLDTSGHPQLDAEGNVERLSRFDYRTGGREAWVRAVDAVELGKLTPDRIQQWRLAYLAKAGDAPDARRRATNSVNAHLRNARALFSPKALAYVRDKLTLPDPLPFAGIKPESRPPTRYISRIDARAILTDAKNELAADPSRMEQFKILCLCLMCGLRKREADSLLWRQVDFAKRSIKIETTEYFQPKSEDSHAAIDLEDELLALLRGWKAQAKGEFVIDSKNGPRYQFHRTNYRCERDFAALNKWLKGKGVTAQKPLHELRKELGAMLASEIGIFAAQQVLRHADIRTTSNHYADKKQRITAGLGSILRSDSSILPFEATANERTHEQRQSA